MNRTPYLYITGGDPILHSRFWDFLELLYSKRIPFTIMGNPFHLSDEVCQRMKNLGCRKYQLSLDGLRETHDRFRKSGSYDRTLEAIATIRKIGIHCAIMSTVSAANIDEIPRLIDVVVEHKADIFSFGRYCPTSEAKVQKRLAGDNEGKAFYEWHVEPERYRDFRQCIRTAADGAVGCTPWLCCTLFRALRLLQGRLPHRETPQTRTLSYHRRIKT